MKSWMKKVPIVQWPHLQKNKKKQTKIVEKFCYKTFMQCKHHLDHIEFQNKLKFSQWMIHMKCICITTAWNLTHRPWSSQLCINCIKNLFYTCFENGNRFSFEIRIIQNSYPLSRHKFSCAHMAPHLSFQPRPM